ncbi:hypothetical protein H8959_013736, partial [Pygathrix nigripes]
MSGCGKQSNKDWTEAKTQSSWVSLQFLTGCVHLLLLKGNYYEKLANCNNEDLNKLLGKVIITQVRVLPNIQAMMLPKKTESHFK